MKWRINHRENSLSNTEVFIETEGGLEVYRLGEFCCYDCWKDTEMEGALQVIYAHNNSIDMAREEGYEVCMEDKSGENKY